MLRNAKVGVNGLVLQMCNYLCGRVKFPFKKLYRTLECPITYFSMMCFSKVVEICHGFKKNNALTIT